MRQKQRTEHAPVPRATSSPEGGAAGDGQLAEEQAKRFLDAADDAIERALSRDERAYLSSVPQTGGQ